MDNNYKEFEGKQVYIILKTKRVYSGVVKAVTESSILINDKYHKPVIFNISEISSMEVEDD
jgi:ribosome maturation factor RimP